MSAKGLQESLELEYSRRGQCSKLLASLLEESKGADWGALKSRRRQKKTDEDVFLYQNADEVRPGPAPLLPTSSGSELKSTDMVITLSKEFKEDQDHKKNGNPKEDKDDKKSGKEFNDVKAKDSLDCNKSLKDSKPHRDEKCSKDAKLRDTRENRDKSPGKNIRPRDSMDIKESRDSSRGKERGSKDLRERKENSGTLMNSRDRKDRRERDNKETEKEDEKDNGNKDTKDSKDSKGRTESRGGKDHKSKKNDKNDKDDKECRINENNNLSNDIKSDDNNDNKEKDKSDNKSDNKREAAEVSTVSKAESLPSESLLSMVNELCTLAWDGSNNERLKQIVSEDQDGSVINHYNSRGQTALYCACRQGIRSAVEALILSPVIDINKGESSKNSTPLHVACWSEKVEIAAMLLWMGADPYLQNIYKLTPKDEARGEAVFFYPLFLEEGFQGLARSYPSVLNLRSIEEIFEKKDKRLNSSGGIIKSLLFDRKRKNSKNEVPKSVSAHKTSSGVMRDEKDLERESSAPLQRQHASFDIQISRPQISRRKSLTSFSSELDDGSKSERSCRRRTNSEGSRTPVASTERVRKRNAEDWPEVEIEDKIKIEDWFSHITGCDETTFAEKKASLIRNEGDGYLTIKNDKTGRRIMAGKIKMMNIADMILDITDRKSEIRKKGDLPHFHFITCSGDDKRFVDVAYIQTLPENREALFQLASNFNGVEALTEAVPPNSADFTTKYYYDKTQGPCASISGGGAAITRVHAAFYHPKKDPSTWNQTDKAQLNFLQNLTSHFPIKNGYVVYDGNEPKFPKHKKGKSQKWQKLLMSYNVCYHSGVEVCLGHRLPKEYETQKDPAQVIDQVCVAAVNMLQGNTGIKNLGFDPTWEKMSFILHTAYQGTYISAIHENKKKIFLTMVGGGVFGNNPAKIFETIVKAHKMWGGHMKSPIEDVYLVLFQAPPPQTMEQWYAALAEEGIPYTHKEFTKDENGNSIENIIAHSPAF
eukprot:TRINITY_DN3733_c0_g1_i1.p1 TRINITY_DN3733_c0_g1~~TRINITY_DN3733_c0_g1_i1.p1  ORF type:complete len:1035 (+),score=186.62 TRINITY_DN3733_c0_g1_i1:133-3105(+)